MTNVRNYGTGRRPIGASTITQQVAKNFLLTNEVSIDRKIKEAILPSGWSAPLPRTRSWRCTSMKSTSVRKLRVAAASLNYFDKSLDQLSLEEMAYLAALPKAPSNYHPVRRIRAATGRRDWVLREMAQNGFITDAERAAAVNVPLTVADQTGFDSADAPYFAEEVRRAVVTRFGEDMLYTGGLSVRTTLDPTLQRAARMALERGLEALDRRQGWRGPIGSFTGAGDVDEVLAKHQGKMLDNHFAALVTEVGQREAKILTAEGEARIPFELAFWAYPPRREDGVRPPPLADLRDALAVGDIVTVQPPDATPDLIRDGFEPKPGTSSSQRPLVEGAIVALDPHTGRRWR